jgi:release factor glutamine methyltransferase
MNVSLAESAWTIRRVLGWATEDFRRRSIESARLDAELLLAHALGTDRIRLIVDADRILSPGELGSYRELIKRRRAGEPVAYLVGRREFYGFELRVDPRVLIPRPDSEALVEVALERTLRWSMFGRALDLCTGSGCVAIAFARHRPTWRITGVDLSKQALALASENALRLGAIWNVRWLAGDLFAPLGQAETFELICANPPYVPSAEVDALERTIRDFEPRLALDGGPDGLEVIRCIVEQALPRLTPEGVLALEVAAGQSSSVAELFESAGLIGIERKRDYGGHERVVSGRAR